MLSLITFSTDLLDPARRTPLYRSNRCRYGIDFKNPFTMSNRGASAPECRHLSAEPLVFIIWKMLLEMVEPIGIEPMT